MRMTVTSKKIAKLHPRTNNHSGGVAANSRLREVIRERTAEAGLKFYFPRPILTTDNAAMIAAAGTAHLMRGEFAEIDVSPDPNLRLAVPEKAGQNRRWRI